MLFKSKKLNDGHDHGDEEGVESEGSSDPKMILIPKDDDSRIIGLFGEVEENKVAQIIGMMLDMAETAEVEPDTEVAEGKDGEEEKKEAEVEVLPIEFLLSTPGGSADDMFALYDIMRVVKEKCPIVTFGIGKVMSAGVLLLAAGTKGKRKIGKNCRVMIHSVIGGNVGPLHNLENEMNEIRYIQNAYLKALADETNMTYQQLRRMINRKVNVYLSAEEAVKLGIADIIV